MIELHKAKEEVARQKELDNVDKKTKKKPKSEKFMPPIGQWKNIFVAEGDSASESIAKILGRKGNGFYAMFGVPPNAYDMPMSSILKSAKMMDLKNILGLQFGQTKQTRLNFENIIITTDFDLPGHFIAGQLIGMLYRFGSNLFEEQRVKRLITPLFLVRDKSEKIITWFYTFDDYQAHEKKHGTKYKYDYMKGLGSWDAEDLEHVIKKDGLDNMLEVYVLEDKAKESLDNWLNKKKTDVRKDMLDGFEFNVMELL